jgi:hypothetical protein
MQLAVEKHTIFARETFANLWSEAEPLVKANFTEMRRDAQDELLIKSDLYPYLESMDALRLHTARQDGFLIGYRSLAITRHQHTSKIVAQCDALYVIPAHRGMLGGALLRWSDAALAEEGVTEVFQATKPQIRDLSRFLAHHEYTLVEYMYSHKLVPPVKE